MTQHGVVYENTERTEHDNPTTIHIRRPDHVETGQPDEDGRIAWCGVLSGPDIKSRADFEIIPLKKTGRRDYKLCGQCKMLTRRSNRSLVDL